MTAFLASLSAAVLQKLVSWLASLLVEAIKWQALFSEIEERNRKAVERVEAIVAQPLPTDAEELRKRAEAIDEAAKDLLG